METYRLLRCMNALKPASERNFLGNILLTGVGINLVLSALMGPMLRPRSSIRRLPTVARLGRSTQTWVADLLPPAPLNRRPRTLQLVLVFKTLLRVWSSTLELTRRFRTRMILATATCVTSLRCCGKWCD